MTGAASSGVRCVSGTSSVRGLVTSLRCDSGTLLHFIPDRSKDPDRLSSSSGGKWPARPLVTGTLRRNKGMHIPLFPGKTLELLFVLLVASEFFVEFFLGKVARPRECANFTRFVPYWLLIRPAIAWFSRDMRSLSRLRVSSFSECCMAYTWSGCA